MEKVGRAGLAEGDEGGLVIGEQKGKSLSSGRNEGEMFLDWSPSPQTGEMTRGA